MHTNGKFLNGKALASAALSVSLLFSQVPVALAQDAATTKEAATTQEAATDKDAAKDKDAAPAKDAATTQEAATDKDAAKDKDAAPAKDAATDKDAASTGTSQQSIEQITEEMTRLYVEAEQSQYDLISVNKHLAQTEDLIAELDVKIDQSSKELKKAKDNLSQFVSEDYKQGSVSLIDIILKSTSFDDFITRVTYANKVAEHQRNAINQVDMLFAMLTAQKSDLETARDAQKRYIVEQEQCSAEAESTGAAAVAFLEQLPAETVAQLANVDAEQREAAVQASIQLLSTMDQSQLEAIFGDAAVAAAGAGAGTGSGNASDSSDASGAATSSSSATSGAAALLEALINSGSASSASGSGETASSGVSTSGSGSSSSASSGGSSSGGSSSGSSSYSSAPSGSSSYSSSSSSSTYSDLLSRVYSLIGSGYQWSGYNYTGDNSTSSFTCSGVVDYGLGRDSRSSSPETLYEEVGSNMKTNVDDFEEGDLVFYSYGGRDVGHVGVYVGNGQIIDSIPNGGVAIRNVDYMDVVGGGSIGYSSGYDDDDDYSGYSDYSDYSDYSGYSDDSSDYSYDY